MRHAPWLVALVLLAVLGLQGTCVARREGELLGQIDAWKQSAKQLSTLAAQKTRTYNKAKASAPGACAPVIAACDERDSLRLLEIAERDRQIEAYKKLRKTGKLFGLFPRPRVQVGACFGADGKLQPCLSAGFNIF